MTQLAWSRSHGDIDGDTAPDTFAIPRQADPPSTGGEDISAGVAAAIGGDGGFSLHGTAWDVLAGQGQLMSDLSEFCQRLHEQPGLRAAAVLRSLERVRTELERCPEDAPLTSPIQLTLQNTAVLARALLQRLR